MLKLTSQMIVRLALKSIFLIYLKTMTAASLRQLKHQILSVSKIFQAAAATGRHVFLTGRDAGKVIYTAMKLGYLNVPKGLLVHSKDLKKIPDKELVILETGRMGEPLKSLQKWQLTATA